MRRQVFRRALALSAICALALGGCARNERNAMDAPSVDLPEPSIGAPEQILGESGLNARREVTLHCATGGSLELTTVTRAIRSAPGEAMIWAILDELLSLSPAIGAPAIGQAQLLDVEWCAETVTLRLSLDAAANRSEQDYLLLCASIANTLLELDGVEAVNILSGERNSAVCDLPLGAFTEPVRGVTAAYAQLQAERERFPGGGISAIRRSALLYFPDRGGRYLLPEARALEFDSDDYAAALLAALQAGPQLRERCFSAAPANLELSSAAPEIRITPEGERVLELSLTPMLTNYLALAGVEPWQFYGSLTLSLTSFMPELDAVRATIDGAAVTECALPDGMRAFEDGLMRRGDFAPLAGGCAELCYLREDGTLAQIECALPQSAAHSPLRLLDAMRTPPESNLRSVFPDGTGSQDFLGVRVEDRTATVNLSGNLYSLCQSLDASGERALVYGAINSLAALDGIGAVRFLVEGAQIESLSQRIYLRTALLPDPGLVREPSPSPAPSAAP